MNAAYRHVYVHLPFCDVICHYCDFYTARSSEARHGDLFRALGAELAQNLDSLGGELEALYFGGGTPAVSPPDLLQKFIDGFSSRIGPGTELTLEANPNNVTRETARLWREMGINRISLGIQSLDDQILKRLGRTHSGKRALEALEICASEIENVTGDLIYAVPGQEKGVPAAHAIEMTKAGVRHFSAYHLTLTPSHFLHPKLPPDDFAYEQILEVNERLGALGFRHYEISNFSLPGYESKNNLNYWKGGPYLALGPSAHGFDGNRTRWQNVADWERYVELVNSRESVHESSETLTDEQRKIEALFTGLRLDSGLNLKNIEIEFSCRLVSGREALFLAWEKEGLGRLDNGVFLPTFKGRMLADEIAQKLL